MSQRERSLRDELERLQTASKALGAELAVEHAPAFFEQREALTRAVAAERDALQREEKTLASARAAERDAQLVVDGLDARGRAYNQRNLDVLPLLLLGAAGCAVTNLLGETNISKWQLGFGSGLGLGVLFGPRVVARLFPHAAALPAPASPSPPKKGGSLARSLAFVHGLFGSVVAAALNLAFWSHVLDVRSFQPVDSLAPGAAHVFAQGLLGIAALLAASAQHRVAADDAAGRQSARRIALTSLALLGSVAFTAVPHLVEALADALRSGALPAASWGLAGVFLPWLPFAASFTARWQGPRARPWLLGASLLSTAVMVGLTRAALPSTPLEPLEPLTGFTAAVASLQFGLLGAVLGFDAGKGTWPAARFAAIGLALAGFAGCLFRFWR